MKANPSAWLLRALYEAGLRQFEVASIREVKLVAGMFDDVEVAFMNPVKSIEAIHTAYHDFGVRTFALDCESELTKILTATNDARDLTLCLRHAAPSDEAKISLSKKFGADGNEAVRLLQQMRQKVKRLGVAFHVGSQNMAPDAYVRAIDIVEQTIIRAGVIVDVLNVGGGFPAEYPGMEPAPLRAFVDAIEARFEEMLVAENCELWCEPGRALSATAASLLVRVESRKDGELYINDGVFGALSDAGHLDWPFPVRALTASSAPVELRAFGFYGPTCDDADFIKGPYLLPTTIEVGDYIEIGQLGAYGVALASRFNGFGGEHLTVTVRDAPMAGGVANPEAENGVNEARAKDKF